MDNEVTDDRGYRYDDKEQSEYQPGEEDQPRYQGSPEQNLRQSSTRQQQGLYDETGDGDVAPEINYSRGTERTGDLDRQVTAEVAASHRMERPYESRRKAADKASRMYESVSGAPLEIDEEGRVVEEER